MIWAQDEMGALGFAEAFATYSVGRHAVGQGHPLPANASPPAAGAMSVPIAEALQQAAGGMLHSLSRRFEKTMADASGLDRLHARMFLARAWHWMATDRGAQGFSAEVVAEISRHGAPIAAGVARQYADPTLRVRALDALAMDATLARFKAAMEDAGQPVPKALWALFHRQGAVGSLAWEKAHTVFLNLMRHDPALRNEWLGRTGRPNVA